MSNEQSAFGMRWVKASEKMPDRPLDYYNRAFYFIRWRCPSDPNTDVKDWRAAIQDYFFIKGITDPSRKYPSEVEWLEESAPPDNELLDCLKECIKATDTFYMIPELPEWAKEILNKAKSIIEKYSSQ